MAAGFPGNGQGIYIGDKGGPQIQSPMGSYIASRAGLGGGFGGYYGPQSPFKKRGYQLMRPGAPGQEQITGGGGYSGNPMMAGGMPMGRMGGGGLGMGAGAFQGYGQALNRNRLGLEGIAPGSPNSPEGLVQADKTLRNNGITLGQLQGMSHFAQNFGGMPGYMPSGSAGFGDTGSAGNSLIKRFLNARLGGM